MDSQLENGGYRQSLLTSLDRLATAIKQLRVLPLIFDEEWQDEVAGEIEAADLTSSSFASQRCPMFFQFRDDLSTLHLLDARLAALLARNIGALDAKLREVRACRFGLKQLEHLFELNVLGLFAQQGCLLELGVAIGHGSVDGSLKLYARQILFEVTLTTHQLLSTGPGVLSLAVESMTEQIEHKVRKKVADGRQLALADRTPTVLVIGLHPFAADQLAAEWAIEECFSQPEFASASAVVVSDSWKFQEATLHLNPNARSPLNEGEQDRLRECLVAAIASPPST